MAYKIEDSEFKYYVRLVGEDTQEANSITPLKVIFSIKRSFVELTMKAHGKVDLYFHSYFLENYLQTILNRTKDHQLPGENGTEPISFDSDKFFK